MPGKTIEAYWTVCFLLCCRCSCSHCII